MIDDSIDESVLLAYADEIGADKDEFSNALKKVTRMPRKQFEKVCEALHLIAKQISSFAFQNVQQAREITERRKIEHALRESEDTARVLLNATTDSIILTDKNGLTLGVNERLAVEISKRVEDLIGTKLETYLPEKEARTLNDKIHNTCETR